MARHRPEGALQEQTYGTPGFGVFFVALALSLAPDKAPLNVTVNTRSDRGRIYCAIWSGKRGYPKERRRAAYEGRSPKPSNRRATLRFEVTPGEGYALACFHDENGNQSLDANFMGIPTEGTGASNNARGFMGPPGYDDARFSVTGTTSLTIDMDYR